MKPLGVQQYETQLIETAKSRLKRNADGSFDEPALVREIATLVKFDEDAERLAKAQKIIDGSKRPGATKADGQLMLPGFNQGYAYEPNRLVSDDDGHIIENHRAPPKYKSAETRRAQENAERAFEQFRRKAEESRVFAAWALEEAINGRPALDLTWGNCVAETNLRRDDPIAA